MEIEDLLDKLMAYYKVATASELGNNMGVTQQAISGWKNRNSITAVKKKCRELGIYNEIFGDINTQNIKSISGGQNANVLNGNMTNNPSSNNNLQIPELILSDLNNLFIFAKEKSKDDDLINKLDDFIYQTKKEYR